MLRRDIHPDDHRPEAQPDSLVPYQRADADERLAREGPERLGQFARCEPLAQLLVG
jgi:hypothetical protein